MDLVFRPSRGKPFVYEVGYFDTVAEIKEKIKKKKGFPVLSQTLVFNGNVLPDDLNVHHSDILDQSQIQVILAPDPENPSCIISDEQPLSSRPKEVLLFLKMPSYSKSKKINILVEIDETIKKLKETVLEFEGLILSRVGLYAIDRNKEFEDDKCVRDYYPEILQNDSEIFVFFKHPLTIPPAPSSGKKRRLSIKLRIMVLTPCEKKIPLEVSPAKRVSELRKELEKLRQSQQLELPPEGYFFVYNKKRMQEDHTFRWHKVGQGDPIEVLPELVTSKS